jgi:hypothetical protein
MVLEEIENARRIYLFRPCAGYFQYAGFCPTLKLNAWGLSKRIEMVFGLLWNGGTRHLMQLRCLAGHGCMIRKQWLTMCVGLTPVHKYGYPFCPVFPG